MHSNFTPKKSRSFYDRKSGAPTRSVTSGYEAVEPDESLIANILNYSRALTVINSEATGHIHFILN